MVIEAMYRDLGIIIWTVGSEWNSAKHEVLTGKKNPDLYKWFENEILKRKQRQQSRSRITVDEERDSFKVEDMGNEF